MSDSAVHGRQERLKTYTRAFVGLVARDVRVLQRDVVPFLLRTVMNPVMFTFVFAYVFPKIVIPSLSSVASTIPGSFQIPFRGSNISSSSTRSCT